MLKRIYFKFKWITLWKGVFLKWGNIEIGYWTYINWPNTVIHSSKKHKVKIWLYSAISWWVTILSKNKHNYNHISTNALFMSNYSDTKRDDIWADVIIWNNVWIWSNVVILPGVNIWDGSIIWAWSVVTKDTAEYGIYYWNPAKLAKFRFSEQVIANLKKISWENIDKDLLLKIEKQIWR